jgi:hypothetical protein
LLRDLNEVLSLWKIKTQITPEHTEGQSSGKDKVTVRNHHTNTRMANTDEKNLVSFGVGMEKLGFPVIANRNEYGTTTLKSSLEFHIPFGKLNLHLA